MVQTSCIEVECSAEDVNCTVILWYVTYYHQLAMAFYTQDLKK